MQNVFPRAQPAVVEETIGKKMPNAQPPLTLCTTNPLAPAPIPHFTPFSYNTAEFSLDELCEYEKALFPESNYIATRNTIVSAYHSAGGTLTLGMCQGICDFPFLLKVFDFLEDRRIINHGVAVKRIIDGLAPPTPLNQNCDPMNIGTAAFIPETRPFPITERLSARRVNYKYVERDFLEEAKCLCRMRAALFTSDLFFICEGCYKLGKYPSRYTFRNFHPITPELLNKLWTRKDEYQLLKNIEMHGDDWRKVADNLGKSVEECIFHFLKMPLLDDCAPYPLLPFSTVPNQISTFIGYVSYMVHPSLSADLAKNAIKYLERPDVMEILLGVASKRGREILELERRKRERIGRVIQEALVRCLMLKIDAITEMHHEGAAVRSELVDARSKLIDEAKKLNSM